MNASTLPHPIDTLSLAAPGWLAYATIIAADIGLLILAMLVALGIPLDALAF
jgi:hypothetical protein